MPPSKPDFASTGRTAAAYNRLRANGALAPDPAQFHAVALLDRIGTALETLEAGHSGLTGLFRRRHQVPRGAWLWGDVGRGKTLLMDLFFEQTQVKAKRRVHFHEFMDEMHEQIARFRARTDTGKGRRDPIPAIAKPILRDVRLLCFDEFHVSDITNAMLLARLFAHLFGAGLVVVATSNSAPQDLYKDGLNRQLFVPFIDLLTAHTEVFRLNAQKDYRRDKLISVKLFHIGTGPAAMHAMDRVFGALTSDRAPAPCNLESLGRTIFVPAQIMGTARFSFADLCESPLGARDYLKIAHAFHTLVIDAVPVLDKTRPGAAKRFILLVDTLHDRSVKLAASFAVPLDELSTNAALEHDFARTRSRLHEMQSEDYAGR